MALIEEPLLDAKKIRKIRNALTEKQGGVLPRNLELIQAYRELLEKGKIKASPALLDAIQKRKVRTMSGIANVTVLTKDMGCPGRCIFCPNEKGMPKSYLSNEPAMMRAVQNEFDAYRQVKARLKGLVAQGHDVSKVDIRIAGGTWGSIPENYRLEFLSGIYRALNEGMKLETRNSKLETPICQTAKRQKFQVSSFKFQDGNRECLEELIRQNEKAQCRCVGLWIETRPDWVDENEIRRLRSYGVTGVEIGIQTTDDKVNTFCQRGHGLKESIRATQLLRDAGLKVCHHLMPNLPTATLKSDLKSGKDLFDNEGLRPDYLKIYPMVVIASAPLAKLLKKDPTLHKAYTDEELMKLLIGIKKHIPEYCRLIRVIRDIPEESVLAGNKKTNLRQLMQNQGVVCRCVRCREIGDSKFEIRNLKLKTLKYKANGGQEFFIAMEEPKLDKIVALCRLRLPARTKRARSGGSGKKAKTAFKSLEGAALVRELHVYGRQKSLEKKGLDSKTQHLGLGKRLMAEAERIASKNGFRKIAVIAAIGTREYYKKLGYKLEQTYMTKSLESEP